MKIAIAGGCFPVQHNIPSYRLYHQSLKNHLAELGINAEISIIRYERATNCLKKIDTLHSASNFTTLLFHLRTEPLLRLTKLYYKYIDNDGSLKHSLNIPFLQLVNSEKFDYLNERRIVLNENTSKKEPKIKYLLRDLNNLIGALFGNKLYAIKKYIHFINSLDEYCRNHNIRLIVLGPVSCLHSKFENKLSSDMHKIFSRQCLEKDIEYLSLSGEFTDKGAKMFFPNGMHVSQAGHDYISKIIYSHLKQ